MEALARFCLLAPTKNKQQSRWTRPPSRATHTLVPGWDEAKNRFCATSEPELDLVYFLNRLCQLTTHLHRSMDLLDAHRAVAFELCVRLRVPQSGRRGQGVRVQQVHQFRDDSLADAGAGQHLCLLFQLIPSLAGVLVVLQNPLQRAVVGPGALGPRVGRQRQGLLGVIVHHPGARSGGVWLDGREPWLRGRLLFALSGGLLEGDGGLGRTRLRLAQFLCLGAVDARTWRSARWRGGYREDVL